MISVIICSVNQALAAQVKRNIDTTIGVPWELILMDNSVMGKGITEVYNLGGARATGDILCFVHEDVNFTTNGWGKKIMAYFNVDSSLGLVGVAGAKYKSKTLSGWSTGIADFDCCNILHIDKKGKEQRIYSNPENAKGLSCTVTVDGVFICARKTVWEDIKFNEADLKGFHLYDLDFSFRASLKHKVAVSYEIDLVHLTEGGDFGDSWMEYTILWHKLCRQYLPRYTDAAVINQKDVEKKINKNWLNRLKSERLTFQNRMHWLIETQSFKHLLLYDILKFLIFRPYKNLKN